MVLDANVILADPRLRSERWNQLADSRTTFGTRVCVPAIAIDEAKARFTSSRNRLNRNVREAARGMSAEAKRSVEEAIVQTEREISEYPEWLDGELRRLGVEILPPPEIAHTEIAKRAISRARPFNEQGNGYRDTLHWLSLVELAKVSGDEDYVFVSADAIFADSTGMIHDDLRAEVEAELGGGTIKLAQSMGSVEIPGRYRGVVQRTDLEQPLIERLREAILSESLMQDVPPLEFGLPGARWIEVAAVASEDLHIDTFVVHELTGDRSLEIEFAVDVIVQFSVSSVVGNDPEYLGLENEYIDRKVRFSGVAVVEGSGHEIDAITELDATLAHREGALLADLVLATPPLHRYSDELRRPPRTVALWP